MEMQWAPSIPTAEDLILRKTASCSGSSSSPSSLSSSLVDCCYAPLPPREAYSYPHEPGGELVAEIAPPLRQPILAMGQSVVSEPRRAPIPVGFRLERSIALLVMAMLGPMTTLRASRYAGKAPSPQGAFPFA